MKKHIALIGLLWIAHVSWAQNTHYGSYAGHNSKGNFNSFFGYRTGSENGINSIVSGDNSFFGDYTGYKNQGEKNSFFGARAGYQNAGKRNTFAGQAAGNGNSGDDNVFIGSLAGYTSKGNGNVFIGSSAATYYNQGSNNIFIGTFSGYANRYGHSNFFAGTNTGNKNYDGKDNVFLGFQSGTNNYSGDGNTFLGKESGYNNTDGNENLFAGHKSGYSNRTGIQNVFLGHYSGYYNDYGVRNTIIGPFAGYRNVSGDRNVFIGYQAGFYEEGDDKLYISSGTSPFIYGDMQRKKLAVGGKVDSDYTLHVLGEAFSTGNWVSSDQRYKKDIQGIEGAAEKILALEGKSYEFKENARIQNDSSAASLAFHEGRQFGFLAQEMKEILPELVREDEDGYLAINYDGIIPVLVEAFKELKVANEKLENEISSLQRQIASLSAKGNSYTPGQGGKQNFTDEIMEQSAVLLQNVPNPFNQSAEIRYMVSTEVQQLSLHIYDLKGHQVLQFTHLPVGHHKVDIQAFQLKAGMYLYSLIADEKVVDTKRMIVTQ